MKNPPRFPFAQKDGSVCRVEAKLLFFHTCVLALILHFDSRILFYWHVWCFADLEMCAWRRKCEKLLKNHWRIVCLCFEKSCELCLIKLSLCKTDSRKNVLWIKVTITWKETLRFSSDWLLISKGSRPFATPQIRIRDYLAKSWWRKLSFPLSPTSSLGAWLPSESGTLPLLLWAFKAFQPDFKGCGLRMKLLRIRKAFYIQQTCEHQLLWAMDRDCSGIHDSFTHKKKMQLLVCS